MLTDEYGLSLSTASLPARDAYVEGCAAKLTNQPGAIEAFERALAADPAFALAHAARAHMLAERGNASAARAAIAEARTHAAAASEREQSHVAFFESLISGQSEAALIALRPHLQAWPRDAVLLGTTAFTNGLIGSSGRAGQKRMLLALLQELAPHYRDNAWFAAHHGMALSENGQRDTARRQIDFALDRNPKNPWAAHARAHLSYEEGDAEAGRMFLADWLPTYPREGPLYSHLGWHLALAHLEAGDIDAANRLFATSFAPGVHTGPPRGQLNDPAAFLWRRELAGAARDTTAWQALYEFVTATFPRAGLAFSDLHIALTLALAGDVAGLAERSRQIELLLAEGRYPSGPLVPAASQAFARFEAGDFAAVIAALEPVCAELERLGGSRAQLDLVEYTLVKAYLGAGRATDAHRLLAARKRGAARLPVAGLH